MNSPSKVLAFDQGHTTGIACLQGTEIKFLMIVPGIWLLEASNREHILRLAQPQRIVVEKLPQRNRDELTFQITERLRIAAQDFEICFTELPPGIWKPVIRKTGGAPTHVVGHLKDALNIAWYCQNLD